jgi:hypothetical protein
MSIRYILAVGAIFILGATGWFVLGSASALRSDMMSYDLDRAVASLWGSPIVQSAPALSVKVPGTERRRALIASSNDIAVDLRLEQRRKGLIWYPTYVVDFSGEYAVTNSDAVAQNVRLHFAFPDAGATYDQFQFQIDDKVQDVDIDTAAGVNEIIEVGPGETRRFRLAYRTRGLREWRYRLAGDSGRLKNLTMEITTDFSAVDFPEGSLSPMTLENNGENAARLRWTADDLITRQDVAVTMPEKINPGPLSARMSFFAPVCLLFFFLVIASIGILKKIPIHPMHYLFVTGGFFAFHLLFAYLVDLINVHLAFVITSIVSVGLVVSYLRAALGQRFPWKIAAAGQLFYLVLFSYSFFLKGMTGLTVTIGSIVTLAMLMRLTAGLDWGQVFHGNKTAAAGV